MAGKRPATAARMVGRDDDRARISALLDGARGGTGGALVLFGEPGIGKSMLLEDTIASAAGMRVLSLVGVESEIEFGFAALHQLLAPLSGEIDLLPPPQREALGAALGLRDGMADRFLVALGTLTLLARAAEAQPLLCVVDNVDLVDHASASALAFAARRVGADAIALLLSVAYVLEPPFDDLPSARVGSISDVAARELLGSRFEGRVGDAVTDQIVGEAAGNPLGVLQLAGALSAGELAGMEPLPQPLPLGESLEESLLRRVRRLPEQTQSLLLLIAAELSGEPGLLWRAARVLGLSREALDPAASAGLLRVREQLLLRHAFLRRAIYASASDEERRAVHAALAVAIDASVDPARAAWHFAAAAMGPDEVIAADLAAAAAVAQGNGGYAAAATFLERAAALTPDEGRRTLRLLDAAEATLASGAPRRAARLLAGLKLDAAGAEQRVRAQRLDGRLALALGEDGHTAASLLNAARAYEPLSIRAARDTYLEALEAAVYAGRLATDGGAAHVAAAAVAAPPVDEADALPRDVLLDGMASLVHEGHPVARPLLERMLGLFRDSDDLRWLGLAGHAASEVWDDEALRVLATRRVELAREAGALTTLPNALSQLGGYELLAGRFDVAQSRFEEGDEISAATGNPGIRGSPDLGSALLAAWRGEEADARRLAAECSADATERGIGVVVTATQLALTILELGLGRYDAAVAAAVEATADDAFWVTTRTLPELVEGAVRGGDGETATEAVARLVARVPPRGDWGAGMLAQSRALVTGAQAAEPLYLEAIERLKHCRVVPALARARLLYGEWLRREKRRADARVQLRRAFEMFASFGATAFRERARRELGATGARIRPREAQGAELLTGHESRIARLVSEGASNAEIASGLFLSPRTIEYHLHKIFRKAGVSSRTELARWILDRERP